MISLLTVHSLQKYRVLCFYFSTFAHKIWLFRNASKSTIWLLLCSFIHTFKAIFAGVVSSFVMLIKVFIKLTDAMQMKLLLKIIVVLLVLATEGQWYLSVCFFWIEMLNVSDENTFWFLGTILAMTTGQPLLLHIGVCFTEGYVCVHERRGQIIVTEGLKIRNPSTDSSGLDFSRCLWTPTPGIIPPTCGSSLGMKREKE